MKIGFDISQTGSGKAGCGYFAHALISGLIKIAPQNSYLLLPNFGDFYFDRGVQKLRAYSGPHVDYGVGFDGRVELKSFWIPPGLDARLPKLDILHANNFWCPRQPLSARVVYTIYDLSFIENPEWTTEANRVGCFAGAFGAASSADWIIAISDFTARHFLSVFPSFPRERIEVVYPCSRFTAVEALGKRPSHHQSIEPGRFWLSVGTIEPRKNQRRLVEAYARYLAAGGPEMPLVLAGGDGWLMDDFRSEIDRIGVSKLVVMTGYVQDDELIWLYRNCYANVFLSLFEGFGLPVLEGMQFGAATIAANTTSIPEITGGAAMLVDPRDQGAITAALLCLGRDQQHRNALTDAARRQAARFSWRDSTNRVLDVYARALRAPKHASWAARVAGQGTPPVTASPPPD